MKAQFKNRWRIGLAFVLMYEMVVAFSVFSLPDFVAIFFIAIGMYACCYGAVVAGEKLMHRFRRKT